MKKINLLKALCQYCFALHRLSHLILILMKTGTAFLPILLNSRGLAGHQCCQQQRARIYGNRVSGAHHHTARPWKMGLGVLPRILQEPSQPPSQHFHTLCSLTLAYHRSSDWSAGGRVT